MSQSQRRLRLSALVAAALALPPAQAQPTAPAASAPTATGPTPAASAAAPARSAAAASARASGAASSAAASPPESAQGKPAPATAAPAATVTSNPPPLPPLGDAASRAAVLFDAIVRGDPSTAADFFLPRDAFAAIKAAANPGAIYDGLFRAYERDIRALHANTPELQAAQFVRVELSHRRSWVTPGEEANRLPYWAQRHNWLIYKVGEQERRIELRVLITWQGRWYVTHLSEFKPPATAKTAAVATPK